MAKSIHDTKLAILAILDRVGTASPKQIGSELGGEWLKPKRGLQLRKLLLRMAKVHLVAKLRHGLYAPCPDRDTRERTARAVTVESILAHLRECGGIARTGDIQRAVGDRPRGGHGYDHKKITLALKESPLFDQYFGRGWWNLTERDLETVPVIGKWRSRFIEREWRKSKERDEPWERKRDSLFDNIGSAFMQARGRLNIADVVAEPGIHEALLMMGKGAPRARAQAINALRVRVEKEAQLGTIKERWAIEKLLRDRKKSDLPLYLYMEFELGDVELHLAAPVEFYKACAALFGVCPAQLSRGGVVAMDNSANAAA
jgi:hypothetical protein